MAHVLCSACNAPLTAALYDEQGHLICDRCLLRAQTTAAHKASANKLVSIAYGVPLLGLLGFVFNPFLLISLAAIGNSLYVLRSLRRPDTAAQVEPRVEKAKVGAIAGIVLGGFAALFQTLNLL